MKLSWQHVGGGERRGLLVRIDEGGRSGWGEASPLSGYSPDTLEEAVAALAAWRRPRTAATPAVIAAATASVASASARCALESALLDLAAQRSGVPVHRLLGAAAPRPLPLTPLIEALEDEPPEWLAPWYAAGHRLAKVKIGRDLARELRALERWRAVFPDLRLRADANRRLPVGEAAAICAALAAHGVDAIEEPVAFAELLELERLPIGVALDESLQEVDACSAIDAVAARQPLVAVVLKPPAIGGLLRGRALAARAAVHGAAAIVTHLFDGPVAAAAAAELALALPNAASAGLWPHRQRDAFPPCSAAAIAATTVVPHDVPGLGLGAPEGG
jgi:o-succinylbenzoate synthase